MFFRQFDVLQLQEVGDTGDENWLPSLSLIRSTKLDLTTESPILVRYTCFFLKYYYLTAKPRRNLQKNRKLEFIHIILIYLDKPLNKETTIRIKFCNAKNPPTERQKIMKAPSVNL